MTIDKAALAEKTEILLEYPQIIENVASHSVSEEAALIIKNSHPVYDDSVLEIKRNVMEIHSLLKTRNDEPRSWLPSIGFLLPRIQTEGAVLDIDEFLAVGLFTERAKELRQWIVKGLTDQMNTTPKDLNSLLSLADSESVPDCANIAEEIFKIIDREGNMRDLPVLRAIKKRISSLEKELKTAVTRYSSDEDYKRMLQSPLPSQRDGRTVLAVKAKFPRKDTGNCP